MKLEISLASTRFVLIPTCVTALSLPAASGQDQLLELSSQRGFAQSYDSFGAEVSFIGDFDGDGIVDALVSAPDEDDNTFGGADYYGAVYVLSGATGLVLQEQHGTDQGARFGYRIAGGEDFDRDGINDYVEATPLYPFSAGTTGRVTVFSGASGTSMYVLDGQRSSDLFGASISVLGDVNGDGTADFGVGAPGYDAGFWKGEAGRAYVYSGRTGTVIHLITGTKANQSLGAISGLGDVDGDGHADFGVGSTGPAAGPNGEGTVDVYSGKSATLLYSLVGEHNKDAFGGYLSFLGDVNGDGAPDFIVAAPYHTSNVASEGRVYVYSGPTGALLYKFDGSIRNQQFGYLPTVGGIDFNHDTYDDIIVGSVWFDPVSRFVNSAVYVYSGRTGKELYTFRDSPPHGNGSALGTSVSKIGDLNHDGIDDILVGAPLYSNPYPDEGRAYVFAGNDLFLQADADKYRTGDAITLDVRGGEANALTLIAVLDVSGTSMFVPIVVASLDADGNYELSDTVPPGLSGLTVTMIAYATRPGRHGLADSSLVTIDLL